MQRIEVGNAIHPKGHGLAVDNKTLLPVLQRSFHNPRKTLGPVVTATGNQPHAVAVALNAQPVAVVLDLVEPIGAAGDLDAASGNANALNMLLR